MCLLYVSYILRRGQQHPPPPLDGVSLLTSGHLSTTFLLSLTPCRQYDDSFTRLVHQRVGASALSDTDTEESRSTRSQRSADSATGYDFDAYEYDDDIYAYMDEYEN